MKYICIIPLLIFLIHIKYIKQKIIDIKNEFIIWNLILESYNLFLKILTIIEKSIPKQKEKNKDLIWIYSAII